MFPTQIVWCSGLTGEKKDDSIHLWQFDGFTRKKFMVGFEMFVPYGFNLNTVLSPQAFLVPENSVFYTTCPALQDSPST